jgi:Caspase domain
MMKSPGYVKLRRVLPTAALLLLCQPAFAEKRVALVIGNAAYQNVEKLPNPANDGATIAATLKDAGFDVVDSRHDLPAAETRSALRDFADRARDADIAVVFYAGHGIEVDGANYLIPVDAKLERDTDVYDEAFSLDRVLLAIEPAKKLRLVILDACRDNPFSKNMKRTVASRAIGRGLARIEPGSPNLLIAYSSKAGSTAADGNGRNSPFTTALARHLTTPGLDIRRAFGFVRDDVLKETGNRQEPFVYGSLGGEDVPLVPARPVVSTAAPAAPASNPQADARRDYELALQIGNKSALNAFLAQHPDGFYASLARLQLEKIAAEDAGVAATEKARLTEQERARLAAEGAQTAQQAKAEADARAAEQARIAAEKAKQVAQDQAVAAERNRAAAEALANITSAGDKNQQVAQDQAVAAERNRAAAETLANIASAGDKAQSEKAINLAALTSGPPPADLAQSLQTELRRVGCLTAAADGEWNAASRRSMALFNRYAKTRFDTKLASTDALDTIKLKTARVCPVVCEHGYKADGDRCSRISCAEGTFLNEDNQCEKRREKQPVARRDRSERKQASEKRQVPQARQAIAVRSHTQTGAGLGSKGQPLSGTERERGCNSYGAIMSGVCP